jgi:hypothetical protein
VLCAAAVPSEAMQSLAESADPDPESTHDAGWEYVASLPAGHGAVLGHRTGKLHIFRRAEGAGGSDHFTTDRSGRTADERAPCRRQPQDMRVRPNSAWRRLHPELFN